MLKQLQALIDASQPTKKEEDQPHRRDAYPVRVVLALMVIISIIVLVWRGCAAII